MRAYGLEKCRYFYLYIVVDYPSSFLSVGDMSLGN